MHKVQTVDLTFVKDRDFLIEEYRSMGYTTKIVGDNLELYWGTPSKPKKKEEKKSKDDQPQHKPGQEKTARRLGR